MIEFSAEEKAQLTGKIKQYLREELDVDIGRFDAEFLLDFLSEQLGPFYYNRALYDAQAVLQARLEALGEAVWELEKSAP